MTTQGVAGHPNPRPDPERARDCPACNGWGTLVAPGGHGLLLCPDCQHTAPAAGQSADVFPARAWPAESPARHPDPATDVKTTGTFELRAEHRPTPTGSPEVPLWHISHSRATTALCGVHLHPHGDRADLHGPQALPPHQVCPTCRQRYTMEHSA